MNIYQSVDHLELSDDAAIKIKAKLDGMLSVKSPENLQVLLETLPQMSRFIGPEPWLFLIKKDQKTHA